MCVYMTCWKCGGLFCVRLSFCACYFIPGPFLSLSPSTVQLCVEELEASLRVEEGRLKDLLPEGAPEPQQGGEGGEGGEGRAEEAAGVLKQMAVVQYLRVSEC